MLSWPGTSRLHRTSPGIKLVALVVGATVVVAADDVIISCVLLAVGVGAVLAAGVPGRILLAQALPILVMTAFVVGFQVAIGRPAEGTIAAARLLAVAALAVAVTLTTPAAALVGWLERTLLRLHVRPDRVFRLGLLVGLALRSLGHLGVVAQRVLDARRARGLRRNLRAFAVPTVVAAARFAHGIGEALDARGIATTDGTTTADGSPR